VSDDEGMSREESAEISYAVFEETLSEVREATGAEDLESLLDRNKRSSQLAAPRSLCAKASEPGPARPAPGAHDGLVKWAEPQSRGAPSRWRPRRANLQNARTGTESGTS
jgi:hypothetical protein